MVFSKQCYQNKEFVWEHILIIFIYFLETILIFFKDLKSILIKTKLTWSIHVLTNSTYIQDISMNHDDEETRVVPSPNS